jgi:hypothetical protein
MWRERPRENFASKNAFATWNSRCAGAVAGCINKLGYTQIYIGNIAYLAHRLAWLYMTGEWPKDKIDHRDLCRSNNIFSNIREASSSDNNRNMSTRSDNTSGYKGVYFSRARGKWIAQISAGGKPRNLGGFTTREDAAGAYSAAAMELHGAFARTA